MRCYQLLLIIFSGLLLPFLAQAHPHSWIEQQTTLIGDDHQLTAMKMRWSFDAITTAYTLEGEDMSPAHQRATLDKLGQEIIANMMGDHYFTYLYADKTPLRYKIVPTAHAEMNGKKLVMTFTIELAKPHPYSQTPLKLLIFDPSYYVDMYWPKASDIKLTPAVAAHCQSQLIKPHPSEKDVNYAMSIPADEDPDYPLGQLFTQKLELHCRP